MAIKHAHQTALPNDPAKDVSATAWNDDHPIEATEPVSVTASTVSLFVRVSGVTPNKLVEFCCKFEDGTVSVLQAVIV